MKRLCTKVNLIPVIAKSDTLSEEECKVFKERILADLAAHGISYYQAPHYEMEDEETIAENEELMVSCALLSGSFAARLADTGLVFATPRVS